MLGVLIVDDHPIVREGLRGMLTPEPDLEVVGEARDGEVAVALAASLQPDVILMDLRMPGIDGVTVVREMRAAEASTRAPRTPIIVVSAHSTPEDKRATFEAGADLHLAKPYDVPSLLGTIEGMTTQL